jgi:hypothetical protein
MLSFLSRLHSAFGGRYLAIVVAVYGLNQGMGEGLAFFAEQYLLSDELNASAPHIGLGLSPARYAQVDAASSVPWSIKSLFGLASDFYPILGLHRTPYMILASLLGVLSWLALGLLPLSLLSVPGVTLFLFLGNYSIASPDVMLDASVAGKSREHPHLASDLQTLCWGGFGVFKILSLVLAPQVYALFGAQALLALTALTAVAVTVPSSLGWLGETRSVLHSKVFSPSEATSNHALVWLAVITAVTSLSMGMVSVLARDELTVALCAVFVVSPVITISSWVLLRRVSPNLARICVYIFLASAVQPSSPVIFYWMRDSPENRAKGLPCFSPEFIAFIQIFGYVFFVVGTLMYNSFLSKWSFRSIYFSTQVGLCLLNLVDLVWVTRANLAWGVSDEAFVLGDEVLSPVVSRWNTMPFFVLAAALCPAGSEATVFASAMGLSNLGASVGEYFGVGLMWALKLEKNAYENLPQFVLARALCRLLPIVLIPWLVPKGRPGEVVHKENAEFDTFSAADFHVSGSDFELQPLAR